MKRMLLVSLLTLLPALWSAPAAADEPLAGPLAEFSAIYALSRNGIALGTSRLELSLRADGRYLYSSSVTPGGLLSLFVSDKVEESSLMALENDGLRPHHYRYHRFGGKKERLVELDFDWHGMQVTNDIGGKRWSMEIPEGTLDKLGYQLAIMRDLKRGLRDMEYAIADGGKLKRYYLTVSGEETVETDLGPLRALRIERTKESSKKTTRIWCAPSLDYLPVMIEQVKKGDETLRMVIQSLEASHSS